MSFSLLALLAVQAATPAPDSNSVPAEEVVVVARRGKCVMSAADRIISDREFARRAAEWRSGTPVRVVVGDRGDYRCMAKIMFRLSQYGVTRAEFVGTNGQPR